ncbi:hypothetical protein [Maribacter sp. 2304DJ31-5]|uniref:hypothetical protein n=1 Tax=Maribacter sp. 2304DJ31-5 TaxID=3386273 RepID=UPI0039BC362F
MKTYAHMVGILLTLVIVACSDLADSHTDNQNPIPLDFTVVLKSSSGLTATMLENEGENLKISETKSMFPGFALPDVMYRTANTLSLYHKIDACTGEFLLYDFQNDSELLLEAFPNLETCNITVTAITHTNDRFFISYVLELPAKERKFFVRTINTSSENKEFEDLEISKKPVAIVPANNRLFILTLDEEITDENGMVVVELLTGETIHEMNLGYNVGKIFADSNTDIIISYPELHTTLNSQTLKVVHTQYEAGTEPGFTDSESIFFDRSGKMYYQMGTNDGTTETIPAVYDFSTNTGILYFFENFLTENQLNATFNIAATTAIAFDGKNDHILIGYRKNGAEGKGGILRITPSPDLTFVDNLNLSKIPFGFYTK